MPYLDFGAIKRDITLQMVLAALDWRPVWSAGDQSRGPCPIHRSHSSRSRSFAVKKDGWFCHKCKIGGDQITLWGAAHGMSSYDAALELCQMFRVPAYNLPRSVRR